MTLLTDRISSRSPVNLALAGADGGVASLSTRDAKGERLRDIGALLAQSLFEPLSNDVRTKLVQELRLTVTSGGSASAALIAAILAAEPKVATVAAGACSAKASQSSQVVVVTPPADVGLRATPYGRFTGTWQAVDPTACPVSRLVIEQKRELYSQVLEVTADYPEGSRWQTTLLPDGVRRASGDHWSKYALVNPPERLVERVFECEASLDRVVYTLTATTKSKPREAVVLTRTYQISGDGSLLIFEEKQQYHRKGLFGGFKAEASKYDYEFGGTYVRA